MELNVAAALKQPGKVFEYAMEHELPAQQYGGRQLAFKGSSRITFTYSYDGEAFALTGQLQANLVSYCALCDKAFTEELSIPLEERFTREMNGEEDDSYSFRGETMNLSSMVWDNIFLGIPLQSVCRPGCKGLCPVCGCDLNTTQCDCAGEQKENLTSLAALEQLLDDDKEV